MDGSPTSSTQVEAAPPPVTMRPAQINAIAMVCHEANRYYCLLLADTSQKPWVDAPEEIRESARNGVRFVIENPDAPQSAAHDNWLRFKAEAGWSYGPVKDEAKKQHPCFVAYDQLQLDQRRKDALFRGIVKALTGVD